MTEGDYGDIKRVANKQLLNYPYYLSKELGCETVNYGSCGQTSKSYYDNYNHLINLSNCDTVLVMLGTNARLGGELGQYVWHYANKHHLPVIDAYLHSPIQPEMEIFYQPNDGLHMAREDYRAFAKFIASELKQLLNQTLKKIMISFRTLSSVNR